MSTFMKAFDNWTALIREFTFWESSRARFRCIGPWIADQCSQVITVSTELPTWMYFYWIIVLITLLYLINETLERVKGAQWALFHPVPQEKMAVELGITTLTEVVRDWALQTYSDSLKAWAEVAVPWMVDHYRHLLFVLAHLPTWFFCYILITSATLGFLINETISRYKGVQWSLRHPVPEEIQNIMKSFILTNEQLRSAMTLLRKEIDKGLNPATKASSSVKCFTTYVQDLPSGKESGQFMGLDLGGSNVRVLVVTLNGKYFNMKSQLYTLSPSIMTGPGVQLFDYIASCLHDFAKKHGLLNTNIPLGFTFSFPLQQKGISVGILETWTKGFSCSGVEGQDVVHMLKEAIGRKGDLKIEMIAVLNDTTGTLMSCGWINPKTKIGVILGTGTNACYVEKIENIPGFDGDKEKPLVLVNTEWGAFGDKGELAFIQTEFDKEVDKKSINPGKQSHEKLISGMYLGEIVRLILVRLINKNVLMGGSLTETIQQEKAFTTENISVIESEKRGTFRKCRKVMKKLGYSEVSDIDCHSIRYVCECVSLRAAYLASAGIAVLINKIGDPSQTIGIDGTLYKKHPFLRKNMAKKISELVDDNIMDFCLMISTDGSGRGAALVAASISANR